MNIFNIMKIDQCVALHHMTTVFSTLKIYLNVVEDNLWCSNGEARHFHNLMIFQPSSAKIGQPIIMRLKIILIGRKDERGVMTEV